MAQLIGMIPWATILLAVILSLCNPGAAAERPNIVIVVADDMGWRDTGYSGNPDVKTPHLDDLAGHGVRFDYCHHDGSKTLAFRRNL